MKTGNFKSETRGEFQLTYSTEDPISCVTFAPNTSQFLLVSSWDKSVSLMQVQTNSLRTKYFHDNAVLDVCFQDASHVYSGGLDNIIKMYEINTQTEKIIGKHDDAVKVVENCPDLNTVLTGGWDKMVRMWDPRTNRSVGSFVQPDKVYTIGVCGDKFVVGTKERKVFVWDLRNSAYVLQRRESSLKYQTRCIKCFPNKQGFALSSIEGRVAVEYLDSRPEIQKKKYAFKCHRVKENGIEKIYPVNAITFHEVYNTFATGGGDGYVNIWDSLNKKRLCQFHRYPTSVTSLSFSRDGTALAIACSYVYDETPSEPLPKSTVFIRYVTDMETKPK